MSDERWLWDYFAAAIRILRPRYAIIENVPGLLTVDSGRAFRSVLSSLAALGYDAEWQMLQASDFGAPHKRERLFLVAHPHGEHRQPVFDRQDDFPHDPQWGSAEGIKTWSQWERWLIQARQDDAQRGADAWFRDLDDGFPAWLAENEPLFRALGNAVCVPVAQYVGSRLLQFDATP
jgi:DNA (cytosine-5)-methyltransferase 1